MIFCATRAVGVMVLPSSAMAGKEIRHPKTHKIPNLKVKGCVDLIKDIVLDYAKSSRRNKTTTGWSSSLVIYCLIFEQCEGIVATLNDLICRNRLDGCECLKLVHVNDRPVDGIVVPEVGQVPGQVMHDQPQRAL